MPFAEPPLPHPEMKDVKHAGKTSYQEFGCDKWNSIGIGGYKSSGHGKLARRKDLDEAREW